MAYNSWLDRGTKDTWPPTLPLSRFVVTYFFRFRFVCFFFFSSFCWCFVVQKESPSNKLSITRTHFQKINKKKYVQQTPNEGKNQSSNLDFFVDISMSTRDSVFQKNFDFQFKFGIELDWDLDLKCSIGLSDLGSVLTDSFRYWI